MKRLTDQNTSSILESLVSLITSEIITATEAWSFITKPALRKETKKFSFILTELEVSRINQLNKDLKELLKRKSGRRCSYCKRPMGSHYISWHIEHIYPKTKFPSKIF
uniref:hypothetical protein n=1 Tax=Pseudomonas sp. RW407 TaxID=2202894 RepID=UPI001C468BB0